MARELVVTRDWVSSVSDPIRFTSGTPIDLTGREEVRHGHRWLWAIAEGREGWVPDGVVAFVDRTPYALHDHSAVELTCQAGEVLTAIERTHGWTLCRSGSGETGWVPDGHLEFPEA
ncbi:SH3 domain-containing protein [uncultured Maritimibacter sp.]|uniref:SH3 domain-containing protein n=1 Tax=uncultured Maritimibacter sp. TaxID=991866 RepID=UPI0026253C5F|nr:SH3 domain-containing protein [uncultured Maritimibacter sp.]